MNYETLPNTTRKNCPTSSFFNLINRQMCIKINRKVAFFIQHSRTKKSKYCCHPSFLPSFLCRHSLKLLSPTLPKLMNWILLSPPPLSSDPDNPPECGTCTYPAGYTNRGPNIGREHSLAFFIEFDRHNLQWWISQNLGLGSCLICFVQRWAHFEKLLPPLSKKVGL